MALLLLLQSPEVHLLGITVVSGDAWRDEEVAHALRLVEAVGRADVPVLAGAAFPLVRTAEETRLYDQLYGKPLLPRRLHRARCPRGLGQDRAGKPTRRPAAHPRRGGGRRSLHGAHGPRAPAPGDHLGCRPAHHGRARLQARPALCRAGPGTGADGRQPCPPRREAAEWVNRPRHEFNFWFDPEAASIVLREHWAKVTTTTIDVSVRTRIEPEVLDGLKQAHSPAAEWVTRYTKRPVFPNYLWDELAAAAWIDPHTDRERALRVHGRVDRPRRQLWRHHHLHRGPTSRCSRPARSTPSPMSICHGYRR